MQLDTCEMGRAGAEPPAVVSSQSSPQRDHEDCAVHPAHKKARTGSTLALLGVLACVALARFLRPKWRILRV